MTDQPPPTATSWHRDIMAADGVEQLLDRIAERAVAELAVALAVASLRPLRDGSAVRRARVDGVAEPVSPPPPLQPGSEVSTLLLPARAWWPAGAAAYPSAVIVDLSGDTGRQAPGDRPNLQLFADTPDFFDTPGVVAATGFAAYASLSLLAVDRLTHLWAALETRAIISQAQGVLMERFGVGAAASMDLLRRWSQESHRQVRSLALDITLEGLPFPTEGPGKPPPWTL